MQLKLFLSNAGFWPLWNPQYIVLTLILAALYLWVTGPGRTLFQDASPVSWRRKCSFLSGLFLFYVAIGSPIGVLGHIFLFSAHMLQQALVYLGVTPLLLLGIPEWLIRPLMAKKVFDKVISFFTRPLIALLTFNILISLYHFPVILDRVLVNGVINVVSHTILGVAAFFLWVPVISPVPKLDRMSDPVKLAYLFGASVLLIPACAVIIFADVPLYEQYMKAPRMLPITPIEDQQLGGAVMKTVSELFYGSALTAIFYRWFRRERQKDQNETITKNPPVIVMPAVSTRERGKA